jgi:Heterokaryon incompatibility protein (HET)
VSPDASSDDCISLASLWLADCLAQHPRCSKDLNPRLPDRVLYTGSDQSKPYLYINMNQDHGKYAALSHCWGGRRSLMTKESTLDMHKQGIPFESFPKTFQHAILVCRRLEIDWLWIDSLCIIQDSENDWAVQAAKMGDIYSNSLITIAADGAPDSEYGFLTDSRREMKVKRFQCPGTGGESTEVCVRKKGSGNRDTFNHHFWDGPMRSPLSTRGWVMQESVLAPRILHFTAEELTWECNAQSRCECQVEPHSFKAETPMKLMINDLAFHSRWETLVRDFTDRHLTLHSDRLPAISGLATFMQKSTTASFLAGFWSDSFPLCLLWMVLDRHNSAKVTRCVSKRVHPYQAPTWSWASVTGRVHINYTRASGEHLLEHIEVICTPAGPNMYGSLQSAQLRAEGFVASVRVTEGGSPEYYGSKFHAVSERMVDGVSLRGKIEPDVQGDGYEICVEEPHFILIIEQSILGLIILRNSRLYPDAYERVGTFFSNDSITDWLKIATKQKVVLV